MRQWTVARTITGCGSCRRRIDQGEPLQEIAITGVAGKRYRCAGCADGPVNDVEVDHERFRLEREAAERVEIHAPGRVAERAGLARGFTPVSTFQQGEFFDAKSKAAGE